MHTHPARRGGSAGGRSSIELRRKLQKSKPGPVSGRVETRQGVREPFPTLGLCGRGLRCGAVPHTLTCLPWSSQGLKDCSLEKLCRSGTHPLACFMKQQPFGPSSVAYPLAGDHFGDPCTQCVHNSVSWGSGGSWQWVAK